MLNETILLASLFSGGRSFGCAARSLSLNPPCQQSARGGPHLTQRVASLYRTPIGVPPICDADPGRRAGILALGFLIPPPSGRCAARRSPSGKNQRSSALIYGHKKSVSAPCVKTAATRRNPPPPHRPHRAHAPWRVPPQAAAVPCLSDPPIPAECRPGASGWRDRQ